MLDHWILAIHRLRLGVPDPLFWDLAWLIVFGGAPLAAGLWLRRSGDGAPPGGSRRRAAATAAMLALAVVTAGPVAALPPSGAGATIVLFRPGTGAARAFEAVAAVGGRVVWADPSGELLAVELGPGGGAWRLYGRGALLVADAAFSGACLAWARR